MAWIRITLLLLVLGGLTLFLAQNWSPIIPLVLLGTSTAAFPVAVWILIFFGIGFFTSLCLQFLSFLQRRFSDSPKPSLSSTEPFPQSVRTRPQNSYRTQPTTSYREEPVSAQTRIQDSSIDSEWEKNPEEWDFGEEVEPANQPIEDSEWAAGGRVEDDDWDIETPPSQPTKPATPFDWEAERVRRFEQEAANFEAPPKPQSTSQSGTVYSYRYREAKPKPPEVKVDKNEQVYDANYRVITPPYRQLPEQKTNDDEDEDWV